MSFERWRALWTLVSGFGFLTWFFFFDFFFRRSGLQFILSLEGPDKNSPNERALAPEERNR
jgi:hypothetical protein